MVPRPDRSTIRAYWVSVSERDPDLRPVREIRSGARWSANEPATAAALSLRTRERLDVECAICICCVMNFDLDALMAGCRSVRHLPDAPNRIADLLRRAIAEPDALTAAISARREARPKSLSMAQIFLNEDDLTIYQLSFPPNLWGVPHDHATWAVIGVYAGAEAFTTYDDKDGKLFAVDRQIISAGEVAVLPPDLIHDIDNPTSSLSGSIHVYGNRHFDHPGRRIWRRTTDSAEPFSPDKAFRYSMALTEERRRESRLRSGNTER